MRIDSGQRLPHPPLTMRRIHGTCVLVSETGVLLRGPSGSGKSDLALRLIDGGARLVADDQVELTIVDGRPLARAPERLAGHAEVRGLGILLLPSTAEATVGLVADLVPESEAIDRLPEAERTDLCGAVVPCMRLHPFQASAPAKIRLAVAALEAGRLLPVPPPFSEVP